ncbi:MAG: hypothetical protein A3F17_07090 [Gammaproteobacteria bacterium RIFCSPHIGHO2_12_FULL_41_15]|nr:MAG: hypothetical protein A3F17_07090 [Gammaproteobacteria bacterium RIFCSPHIGHO2_12_FULL_41_15]
MTHESLLKFPCNFPIKVFSQTSDDTLDKILVLFQHHFPKLQKEDFIVRHSKDKKYLALTVTVHAESKEQLDALYMELNASEQVIMTL